MNEKKRRNYNDRTNHTTSFKPNANRRNAKKGTGAKKIKKHRPIVDQERLINSFITPTGLSVTVSNPILCEDRIARYQDNYNRSKFVCLKRQEYELLCNAFNDLCNAASTTSFDIEKVRAIINTYSNPSVETYYNMYMSNTKAIKKPIHVNKRDNRSTPNTSIELMHNHVGYFIEDLNKYEDIDIPDEYFDIYSQGYTNVSKSKIESFLVWASNTIKRKKNELFNLKKSTKDTQE